MGFPLVFNARRLGEEFLDHGIDSSAWDATSDSCIIEVTKIIGTLNNTGRLFLEPFFFVEIAMTMLDSFYKIH